MRQARDGIAVTPSGAHEGHTAPLTHFFHCWRFPDHHACAVALIERQAAENDALIVRVAGLERELRDRPPVLNGKAAGR